MTVEVIGKVRLSFMKATTKRKLRKIISFIRRIGLKNRDFTIISNNCWGGFIYDIFGLKYQTPTIGTYFFSEDYVKFVNNLDYYLGLDVKPLRFEDSKHKDVLYERGQKMLY